MDGIGEYIGYSEKESTHWNIGLLTVASKSKGTSSCIDDDLLNGGLDGGAAGFSGPVFILTSFFPSFFTSSSACFCSFTCSFDLSCEGCSVVGSSFLGNAAGAVSAGLEVASSFPSSLLLSDASAFRISFTRVGESNELALSHSSMRGDTRSFMAASLTFSRAGITTDSPNLTRELLRRSHFVALSFSNNSTS